MSSSLRFSKKAVADLWIQQIPLVADTDYVDRARKRIVEVEKASLHEYHVVFIKACEIYMETQLTQDDLDKIKLIKGEIDTELGKIKAKKDKGLKSRQKALAEALDNADFAKAAEIMAVVDSNAEKASGKEREQIRVLQKQVNSIENKRILAVTAYLSKEGWYSDEESGEESGTNQYSFEADFVIESTLKTAGYSFELAYNWQSRSLFIKPDVKNAVADWHGVIPLSEWSFISFLPDLGGKNKVTSRKRLCQVQYHLVNMFVREKPKNLAEVQESCQKVWNELRNGNWSTKYSGGANSAFRLVETLNTSAKDYGHQRLREIYGDLPWLQKDWEETLKTLTESEETAVDDTIAAEAASADADPAEVASADEQQPEPAQKAA